jgi:hypothetical protein
MAFFTVYSRPMQICSSREESPIHTPRFDFASWQCAGPKRFNPVAKN